MKPSYLMQIFIINSILRVLTKYKKWVIMNWIGFL